MKRELKKIQNESRYLIKEAQRILKKWQSRLESDKLEPLLKAVGNLETALARGDAAAAQVAKKQLEHLLETDFAFARKGVLRDWAESLFVALLIALFLRTFVIEAFKIPSGSMIPTLLIGDHIFVNKFIYGIRLPIINKRIVTWGEPERGEVIVFVYPHDTDKDYIKRVIGLPGDRITVTGTEVLVNGERIMQSTGHPFTYVDVESGDSKVCVQYDSVLGRAQFNTLYDPHRLHPTTEYIVEPGHYFVMGDNRDNSADSRAWGQVPLDNIKGRALVVWWSSYEGASIRFDRIGHLID